MRLRKRRPRILLISASPRKNRSQTFLLAQEAMRGCGSVEQHVIHLTDHTIGFCRHCERCHRKIMACPIKDDAVKIMEAMLEADGIIMASPNYINQVTGLMKTLLDRASHFIHCKRLLGKYVVAVVSSGGGFDKDVLSYIEYWAHTCGAQYSGGVSGRVPVSVAKLREAFRAGRGLADAIRRKTKFPEQARIIEKGIQYFGRIIRLRKDDWIEEYKYWKGKGWL